MATTTKAKEDDDDDKQMTRTISPPPTTTTATTAATTATTSTSPTQPTAALNRLKDLPPVIQDRQSSGGDESITSSTSFNPFEPSSSTLFLPLPNPSTNKSRSSFVLSNDELPSEIANADISIASESPFFLFHAPCPIARDSIKFRPMGAFLHRTEGNAYYAMDDLPICTVFPATCTDPSCSGSRHSDYRFLLHMVTGAF